MALIPWTSRKIWEPLEEMRDFEERMNRLFDETWRRFPISGEESLERTWSPPVDIYEDKENIIVKAELPGVKKDDVVIEVKDNVLTFKGERKKEKEIKKDSYHRLERVYGKFSRSFTLPDSVRVDKVKANYKDGILEITLPKTEEIKPRAIPITIE